MVDKQQFVKLRSSVATSKESFLSYFLFEECVIYCKEIKQRGKTTGYKFKGSVPVMGLTVRDQVTDVPPGEGMHASADVLFASRSPSILPPKQI